MRKWTLVALILFPLSLPLAAHADTVFILDNGSIQRIQGTIVRNLPGESVHIQTSDGKVLVLKRKNIVNIVSSEDTSPSLHGMSADYVSPFMVSKKDPTVAFLLSFLIPGGGQFYNGESGKGTVQLLGAVGGLALAVAYLPASVNTEFFSVETGNAGVSALGIGVTLASAIWSMIDAPMSAQRINQQQGLTLRPSVTPSNLGFAANLRF